MSSAVFRSPKKASLVVGAALALATPVAANAALDMYMDIPGIPGDTTATGIPDIKSTVDVLAWSWGISNSGTTHGGAGGGAGRANLQDLSFTKYFGAGSPAIFRAVATGQKYPNATLRVYGAATATAARQLLWVINLSPVLITSESTGGSGGESRLTENVTLNFQTIRITDVLTGVSDCFNAATMATC